MPYHRGFMRPRKYTPSTDPGPKPAAIPPQSSGPPEDIPLPNIPENPMFRGTGKFQQPKQNFLTLFNTQIHLEEIILLGIIFVLLQEGVEDELLLIILLFILFTGQE